METLDISNLKPMDSLRKIMELIASKTEYSTLITNALIATFLQDGFESQQISTGINVKRSIEPFKIIQLKNTTIYLDPNMRWDDTRLIFKSTSDDTIQEVTIIHSNNLI